MWRCLAFFYPKAQWIWVKCSTPSYIEIFYLAVVNLLSHNKCNCSFGPALIGVWCLVRVKLLCMKCMLPRQARAFELMLFWYWSNVRDDEPASKQLWFDKSYHLELYISPLFPVGISTRHAQRVTTMTIFAVQSCRHFRFVCTISIFLHLVIMQIHAHLQMYMFKLCSRPKHYYSCYIWR